MSKNLKVLIIDDNYIVHLGLKSIINGHWNNVEYLDEGSSSGDVIEIPDIIILGTISSNKSKGVSELRHLGKKFPYSRILVFTSLDEWFYGISYLKSGAKGYLSKSANKQLIVLAITAVLEGTHLFCSNELKDRFFNDFLLDGLIDKVSKKNFLKLCRSGRGKD